MSLITKGYTDGPFGQVHWRSCGQSTGGRSDRPALICLHPAPFSGLAFTAIMPHLAKGRRVIAPDFPGHGGSDPHVLEASIEDYAASILSVIVELSTDAPVDLMGFHSGCLVACEIALQRPAGVRRLALVDAPAFTPELRSQQLASSTVPPGFTADLTSLSSAWERGITRRIESQGMERSFAMFVEHLRHGEAMNAGFHAAFTYPLEERLGELSHPVTVIATQSMLLEASRRAAELIPGAELVERLDITRAVLDEAAETTAESVLEALGG